MDKAHLFMYLDGAGLFAIAAAAIYMATKVITRSSAMHVTKTITAGEATAAATPDGTTVELKGTAETAVPLTSPVTNTPCVYFRQKVEELHEHHEYSRDGGCYTTREWREVSDTCNYTPFALRDSSGTIQVVMQNADAVGRESAKHVPAPAGAQFGAGMGGTMEQVGELMSGLSGDTGQRRQTVWVIDAAAPVYVLGSAVLEPGGVVVKKGEGPFIVSGKPEEKLTRSYDWRFAGWSSSGAVALAMAVLVLYFAISRKTVTQFGPKGMSLEYVLGGLVLSFLVGLGYLMYRNLRAPTSLGATAGSLFPAAGLPAMGARVPGAGGGASAASSAAAAVPGLTAAGLAGAGMPGPPQQAGAPTTVVPQGQPVTAPGARIGVIQHEIVIGGAVAFKQGDRLQIEGESPDPDRPDYKYVVTSPTLNKKFRLSDMDIFT